MRLLFLLALVACESKPTVYHAVTQCEPTRDRAIDRVKIGAMGKCWNSTWTQLSLHVDACETGGYSAVMAFRCEG